MHTIKSDSAGTPDSSYGVPKILLNNAVIINSKFNRIHFVNDKCTMVRCIFVLFFCLREYL